MRTLLHLQLGRVDLAVGTLHTAGGRSVPLSPKEARLLAFLAGAAPDSVDTDTLLRVVWGYAPGVRSRTVQATVHTLRRKVERRPGQPEHILTVRGVGYRFVPRTAPPNPALRSLQARMQAESLAVDMPHKALAALDDLPGGDPELHLARAKVAERLGLLARAQEELMLAEAMGGRWHAGRVGLQRARLYRRGARPEAARDELGVVMATAVTANTRVAAAIQRAVVRLELGDAGGWDDFHRARAWMPADAHPTLRAVLDLEEGLHAVLSDRRERGRSALWAGLGWAVDADRSELVSGAHVGLALVAAWDGAVGEALTWLDRTDLDTTHEPGIHALAAWSAGLCGDHVRADRLLDRAATRHLACPNPADAALVAVLKGARATDRTLLERAPRASAVREGGLVRQGLARARELGTTSLWATLRGDRMMGQRHQRGISPTLHQRSSTRSLG